jgi:hypothetical protein
MFLLPETALSDQLHKLTRLATKAPHGDMRGLLFGRTALARCLNLTRRGSAANTPGTSQVID